MNAFAIDKDHPPDVTLQRLIEQYGLRAMLLGILTAALRMRRERVRFRHHDLPDHLRRDVGLPPVAAHRGQRYPQ
jgi:hypothetical protein